jgi:dTDP-4-amino-4,6-dideoxygalactose transaminase
MTKNKITVTQPSLPALEDFIPYLKEIWENKQLTNNGPFHQQFEKELCEYLGVEEISLFCNGTIALIVALRALEITGEVITTPYSFVATAHSLLLAGAKPVFVDIEPRNFNIDAKKIEAAITEKTTAIMPVHVYGTPCDVDEIQKIASRYNLKVIYDAAHAFGVDCHCGSVLRHGDLSVISFHATKVFNTFEGGAIVSHTKELKNRIDNLKNFGITSETEVNVVGLNGKMNEIQAAFGLLQIKNVNIYIEKRRLIAERYRKALRGISGIKCVESNNGQHSNYNYFPILVGSKYPHSRDELYQSLKEKGVLSRRYFYPLISSMPMYSAYSSAAPRNLPLAQSASEQVLCLPIYPDLTKFEQEKVIEIISNP